MTRDESIQAAFEKTIEPMAAALMAIQRKQDEHTQRLRNIDGRLVRTVGLLDGVEILVRNKTGP